VPAQGSGGDSASSDGYAERTGASLCAGKASNAGRSSVVAANQGRDVPGGVTVVAMLAIVVGIVELFAGIVMVIFSDDVSGYSTTSAIVFGILTFVVGAIYLWVGRGLLKLDPGAWMVGLFISGLRAVYDVVWLIVLGLDGIGITTLIALVINLLVFAALWSGRAAFGAGGAGGADTPQPA
jgi:hypothetical protein